MIALGPVAARPASAALGAPLSRFRGVPGRLARDNAFAIPGARLGPQPRS